jgi:hypothetical protein
MGQKVVVIGVQHRREEADKLQHLLTEHGCEVKARLGLHEAGSVCSDEGLIILQLVPDEPKADSLVLELNKLDGIKAKLVEV